VPWYAIYTKSRCEKKVHQLLTERGIESYCPTIIVKRQWSDRIKKVEQPIFTSYVFVNIHDNQFDLVRLTNHVVNFVYWLGKPAKILSKEIEEIKVLINNAEAVTFETYMPKVNSKLVISKGVFKDVSATVKKIVNNKIVLYLPGLQGRLIVKVKKP
jgi:transcription antitermination factor NusG